MLKYLLKKIIKIFLLNRFFFFFISKLLSFLIPVNYIGKNKKKILLLSKHRFNKDIEILSKDFSFIYLTPFVQSIFIRIANFDDSYPYSNSRLLKIFFKDFLFANEFSLVISATGWYKTDIPIGNIANETGIPYLIFHKECFKYSDHQLRTSASRLEKLECNPAEIIVHTDHHKKIIKKYLNKKFKFKALGNLRMDNVYNYSKIEKKGKGLVFFTFNLGVGLDDLGQNPVPRNSMIGWRQLFFFTCIEIINFAKINPKTNVTIKIRDIGSDKKNVASVFAYLNINHNNIPNLKVTMYDDPHELIINSNVVVSFASTTLLEAAVLKKHIIIPNFGECNLIEYKNRIKLIKEYKYFNIANSPEHLNILLKNKTRSLINNTFPLEKKKLYKDWVDPFDGKTYDRYKNYINHVFLKNI